MTQISNMPVANYVGVHNSVDTPQILYGTQTALGARNFNLEIARIGRQAG